MKTKTTKCTDEELLAPVVGCQIRAGRPEDIHDLLDLHIHCHPHAGFDKQGLARFLAADDSSRGVQLAAVGGETVGYLLWKLKMEPVPGIRFVDVGVHMTHRRAGVATMLLLTPLQMKLTCHAWVPERDLPAQLLLRQLGMVCEKIMPNRYTDPVQDGYFFIRNTPNEAN